MPITKPNDSPDASSETCLGAASLIGPLGRSAAKAAIALAAVLLAALAAWTPERADAAAETHPVRTEYQSHPFAVTGGSIPRVLLVLSKDLRMFQQGYPALTDLDGDGRVDTGFNPSIEYVGYFDSRSCYAYSGSTYEGLAPNQHGQYVFAYGDADGYFYRSGSTIEDETEAQIGSGRPAGLKSYVPSPRSPFGVCHNPSTGDTVGGQRGFSGNWLNFIGTSRIDAARKILYGGKRKIDALDRTVLDPSMVPPDSTVWGTEIRSDDTWMEITPLSAYHDITKYTPFDKPVSHSAHFVARGSDLGPTNRWFGALRVLQNAHYDDFAIGEGDSVSERVGATLPYGRYWDWVLVNRPLPDDIVLKPAVLNSDGSTTNVRETIKVYNLSVEVCAKDNIGPYEGCLRFPGATADPSDDVWKPGGLIQRYGQGATQMHFGLLTGHYGWDHQEGGRLRNHVGPVMGSAPGDGGGFVPPVDASTGQVLATGLIANIDNLSVAGRNRAVAPALLWSAQSYGNTKSWSNPLGEMLYEAVRYMAGLASPTSNYASSTDPEIDDNYHFDYADVDTSVKNLTEYRGENSWLTDRPEAATSECSAPVILVISDVYTAWDGNTFGTVDLKQPLISGLTLPPGLADTDLPVTFNSNTYLDTISKLEGLTATSSTLYSYSTGTADSCLPKTLASLRDVKGVCPFGPSKMGTYSVASAAYYAHVHDFNLSDSPSRVQTGIDVYTVALSSAFPELRFPIMDSSGKVLTSVSLVPTNISGGVGANPFMGLLNYFILEWDADRKGQTFHAKIKVNFSDADAGDDWEGDGQVTFEIDLLTDAATPASMRGDAPAHLDAGERRDEEFYVFKNPSGADSTSHFIDIQPGQVKAIRVASSWLNGGTGQGMGMGYTISGTTRDGPYLDLTMNTPPASPYLTPKDCPYVGGPTDPPDSSEGCGKPRPSIKSLARVFSISSGTDSKTLPSTMWLAAKYGGFKDHNSNGVPDEGEWEGDDGNPWNYFGAATLNELPDKLEGAFLAIARSITTGTATSASVNSVMGGGISVHTAYYPKYTNPSDSSQRIDWVGTVYGLFVDKWGNVREDSNGDRKLTLATGALADAGDFIVTFSSVSNPPAPEDEPDCFKSGSAITLCGDPLGDNNPVPLAGYAGSPANIHQLKAVWDTGRWLAELDAGNSPPELTGGSRAWSATATRGRGQRRIYFTDPETLRLELFNAGTASLPILTKHLIHDNWALTLPLPPDTAESREALTVRLVDYIQGAEIAGWRSRTVDNPWAASPARVVWRLGDVVNSKPVVVGAPSFNYDTLYGSVGYSQFRTAYGQRRQVVYVGANDGMLHAINAGYYGSLAEGKIGYSDQPLSQGGQGQTSPPDHELGSEIWAYIPASILPHLKWLADPEYSHTWMVDMKPLVADVLVDGQWRTVLIGGLRLGGRPIEGVADDAGANPEPWYSEVFCLDITDPESEPQFMWRYSSLELGLSVGMPAVVRSGGEFYVVLASGPKTDSVDSANSVVYGANTPYDGWSDQRARLIVLKASDGTVINTADRLVVPETDGNSFFNEPFVPVASIVDRQNDTWSDHVAYYGLTISRDPANCEDSGAVYRLKMADVVEGKYVALTPDNWTLKRFMHTGRPVTGAVNATYDRAGNMWIVFATGRLWSIGDLTPCSAAGPSQASACAENHKQYLYGVKEVLDPNGLLTFADRTSQAGSLVDVSTYRVGSDAQVTVAGGGAIDNEGNTSQSYTALANNIMDPSVPGFKRLLNMGQVLRPNESHQFEINFYQPKILGMGNGESLVAFTTFEPKNVTSYCGELGRSYMYILDTYTGLASPSLSSVFLSANPAKTSTGANLLTGGMETGTEIDTEVTIYVGDGVAVIGTDSADNAHWEKRIPSVSGNLNSVISWREAINTGFSMDPDAMVLGLDPDAAP